MPITKSKKTFVIQNGDIGSEAFCDEYVREIEDENARLKKCIQKADECTIAGVEFLNRLMIYDVARTEMNVEKPEKAIQSDIYDRVVQLQDRIKRLKFRTNTQTTNTQTEEDAGFNGLRDNGTEKGKRR